jgi:hypothetical protein
MPLPSSWRLLGAEPEVERDAVRLDPAGVVDREPPREPEAVGGGGGEALAGRRLLGIVQFVERRAPIAVEREAAALVAGELGLEFAERSGEDHLVARTTGGAEDHRRDIIRDPGKIRESIHVEIAVRLGGGRIGVVADEVVDEVRVGPVAQSGPGDEEFHALACDRIRHVRCLGRFGAWAGPSLDRLRTVGPRCRHVDIGRLSGVIRKTIGNEGDRLPCLVPTLVVEESP